MLFATDYEILRGLTASSQIRIPLTRKPVRVATLLDEADLTQRGGELVHQKNVFLDDRGHDWHWDRGIFTYYSHIVRVGDKADVVVVYATATDKGSARHGA